MTKEVFYFVLTILIALLLTGCSNDENVESEVETYNEARKTAWIFVNEKGWNKTASDDWQNAEVSEVVVDDDNYDLVDGKYEGKEALSVSFDDQENSAISTPLILVEPDTNEVIGYMFSE